MNYTSIEQSKKLLELGLSLESADMYYEDDISVEIGHPWHEQHIPCWSVGALLNVMHKTQNVYHDLVLGDRYPYIAFDDEGSLTHETYCGMTILEACYNMVVWLLENNHIKKE